MSFIRTTAVRIAVSVAGAAFGLGTLTAGATILSSNPPSTDGGHWYPSAAATPDDRDYAFAAVINPCPACPTSVAAGPDSQPRAAANSRSTGAA